MDEDQARRTVTVINIQLQQRPWFDFEVKEYRGDTLTIMGSLDPSAPHDIEIWFKGVFFLSLPTEWKTDTSRPPLALLTGPDAVPINRQFQVERGNHIFRFTPEDYPPSFGCLIGAREIGFDLMNKTS